MATEDERPDEVVKWYTRARKFPQLLGRAPDGTRIPGGPYTITQAVGGGGVLVVGLNTMSLWANFGMIGNAFVLIAAFLGTVFGLGRLPVGSRNPLSVAAGAFRAISAPATGRLQGRPVRIRRPHQLRHAVVYATAIPDVATTAEEAPASATAATPRPSRWATAPISATPSSSPARVPALTGVQALLAAGARNGSENS